MGTEHSPDTVWRAQELYCVDRLSFAKVAELTSVSATTLKAWGQKYKWAEKREEIAKAESEIRADKIMARSRLLKSLLEKPDAQSAFAVSALENLALKEAEAERQGLANQALLLAQESQLSPIQNTADALAALRSAIERRLHMLLSRPESVDLHAVKEVEHCLSLATKIEKAMLATTQTEQEQVRGIPADIAVSLREALGL